MYNWHNLPKYEYLSFSYDPDIDEYDDNRKIRHDVYRNGKYCMFRTDWSPYSVPTEEQFQDAVIDFLLSEWFSGNLPTISR
jgi:hypothetical protein